MTFENGDHIQFDLYEGVEPADAVHQFMMQHSVPEEFRSAMMERACAAVECKRLEPGTNDCCYLIF